MRERSKHTEELGNLLDLWRFELAAISWEEELDLIERDDDVYSLLAFLSQNSLKRSLECEHVARVTQLSQLTRSKIGPTQFVEERVPEVDDEWSDDWLWGGRIALKVSENEKKRLITHLPELFADSH